MPYIIHNNTLELQIDYPTEHYNHARFDWMGKIKDLSFKGIRFAGYEKENGIPGEFIGKGFYNEFGIEKAIGFSECKNGDWFHKIGIGLLQKEGDSYAFHHPYKIKALDFQVQKTNYNLIFQCKSPICNGFGYYYQKEIILNENGFEVQYLLENIGTKTIETDEYNHNFVNIGNDQIGSNYSLHWPFLLKPGVQGEVVNPKNIVDIGDTQINFKDKPDSPFFYSFLNGKDFVPAQWEIVNHKIGYRIQEKGDFTCSKINLWGWKGAVSPELFKDIAINPGDTDLWKRSYTIREI
jgi:hypothetical protein